MTKITVRDFAAAGRVDDLVGADGGQVSVALIGEDDLVGLDALEPGRHGRRVAVRRLAGVGVEVVVSEDGASHRRNADGALADAQLVDHLAHKTVDQAMGAAGTVVCEDIGERLRPPVHHFVLGQVNCVHGSPPSR